MCELASLRMLKRRFRATEVGSCLSDIAKVVEESATIN